MIPNFWILLRTKWRSILLQWDVAISIVLGLLCSILPGEQNITGRYTEILVAEAGIATGLLGVVLGSLAILMSFMSERALLVMAKTGRGLSEDIFPYSYTALVCVLAILSGFTFSAIVAAEDTGWIRVALFVTSALFIYSVLCILSLINALFCFFELKVALSERDD